MYKIVYTFVLVLAIIASVFSQEVVVDQKAPDFSLMDSHGKKHSLSDYAGKYVVLEWVNFDCPFVRKHYNSNNMQKLQSEYTKEGVIWLTVCSSAPDKQGHYDSGKINELMKEKKMASTAYLMDEDGTVGKLYGAKATPHMFVIDTKGVLRYAGAIDDKPSTKLEDIEVASNYVVQTLEALKTGNEPTHKTTTAYGCGVKYK